MLILQQARNCIDDGATIMQNDVPLNVGYAFTYFEKVLTIGILQQNY